MIIKMKQEAVTALGFSQFCSKKGGRHFRSTCHLDYYFIFKSYHFEIWVMAGIFKMPTTFLLIAIYLKFCE